jgi:hypothetical protein
MMNGMEIPSTPRWLMLKRGTTVPPNKLHPWLNPKERYKSKTRQSDQGENAKTLVAITTDCQK